MDVSSRWYKAAGASLIAGAVTARYIAKWRRSRSMRRGAQEGRGPSGGRYIIGLDLTDPYAKSPCPCDVAVLDPDLNCTFALWEYSEDGSGIVPTAALGRAFVLAVDGPQGLAGQEEATSRESERAVHTPGRTPYELPANGAPYAGFTVGSVRLFHRLMTSGSRFRLLGMENIPNHEANLVEVFPGAGWKTFSDGHRLPRKDTVKGREARYAILQVEGVKFSHEGLPTSDQLDAAMAAWTGYLFNLGLVLLVGSPPWLDKECAVIREGYIVQPVLGDGLEGEAEAEPPVAPTA